MTSEARARAVATRPWGKIATLSMEVARNYATVTIPQFKKNAPRKG
jgi:hypothetical protein